MRARFTARTLASKRHRLDVEREALIALGDRVVTYQFAHAFSPGQVEELPLAKHDLLQNLSPDQIEVLTGLMERRVFRAREHVVQRGEPAHELFVLVQGRLSVLTDMPDGRMHRLHARGGDDVRRALDRGGLHTHRLRPRRRPLGVLALSRSAFDSLELANPELKIRLLENLLRSATRTLGRLSFELAERI